MKAAKMKINPKMATETNVKQNKASAFVSTRTKRSSVRTDAARAKVITRKKRAVTIDRYEMRIDSVRRETWDRAKTLLGYSTLKDYLTHLADLDAEKVIEKHEKMTLTNDVFDMFVVACENANKPNDALLNASKLAKEQGF